MLDRDHAIVVQPDIVFVSHARRDRGAKLRLYERYGVREYWLVTPDEWTIEVIELTQGTRHCRTYDVDTPIVGRDEHRVDRSGLRRAPAHVLDHRQAADARERFTRETTAVISSGDEGDSASGADGTCQP